MLSALLEAIAAAAAAAAAAFDLLEAGFSAEELIPRLRPWRLAERRGMEPEFPTDREPEAPPTPPLPLLPRRPKIPAKSALYYYYYLTIDFLLL